MAHSLGNMDLVQSPIKQTVGGRRGGRADLTAGRSFWRLAGNPAERPGWPDQPRLWARRDPHQLKGHVDRMCDRWVWRREEREPHRSKRQQSIPPLCRETRTVSKHLSAFRLLARLLPIDKPDMPFPCPSLSFSPPPRDNPHGSVSRGRTIL